MAEWFECKVTYEKTNDDGSVKKISESYLVDAVNFTDAEAIITKEVSMFIAGDFEVAAVKKEKIYELFKNETGGTWYKNKVSFVWIDELTAKEKKDNVIIYCQSHDIDSVVPSIKNALSESVIGYVITSISETKILDIFSPKSN